MTAFFKRIAERPAIYDAARGADILDTLTKALGGDESFAPAAALLRDDPKVRDLLAGVLVGGGLSRRARPARSGASRRLPHARSRPPSRRGWRRAQRRGRSGEVAEGDHGRAPPLQAADRAPRGTCRSWRGLADGRDAARHERCRRHRGRSGGQVSLPPGTRCRPNRRPFAHGAPRGYFVIAMGKLGGHELNYSSDIDIIVFYDADQAGLAPDIEPSAFFVRLTRELVRLLQEHTGDGYVFRTDLRLRPDPGRNPSGALDRCRAYLLRELRPELGARRPDQGACHCRRYRSRRGVSAPARHPSSGANISTSRRSPTSTP